AENDQVRERVTEDRYGQGQPQACGRRYAASSMKTEALQVTKPFSAATLVIDPAAETERIVTALREQLRSFRKRGLVLGVSGGIDSSVSTALAVRAVGAQNVCCLFMPENDSDPESLRLGR